MNLDGLKTGDRLWTMFSVQGGGVDFEPGDDTEPGEVIFLSRGTGSLSGYQFEALVARDGAEDVDVIDSKLLYKTQEEVLRQSLKEFDEAIEALNVRRADHKDMLDRLRPAE